MSLTPKQIASLEDALRLRRAAYRRSLRDHMSKSRDDRARLLSDRVGDLEDAALSDLIIDLDLADVDRDVAALREIEAAFERMRRGALGLCVRCGSGIPYERLATNPAVARCVDCQRHQEHDFAHFATPSL